VLDSKILLGNKFKIKHDGVVLWGARTAILGVDDVCPRFYLLP
jgi:hypothetical protein